MYLLILVVLRCYHQESQSQNLTFISEDCGVNPMRYSSKNFRPHLIVALFLYRSNLCLFHSEMCHVSTLAPFGKIGHFSFVYVFLFEDNLWIMHSYIPQLSLSVGLLFWPLFYLINELFSTRHIPYNNMLAQCHLVALQAKFCMSYVSYFTFMNEKADP